MRGTNERPSNYEMSTPAETHITCHRIRGPRPDAAHKYRQDIARRAEFRVCLLAFPLALRFTRCCVAECVALVCAASPGAVLTRVSIPIAASAGSRSELQIITRCRAYKDLQFSHACSITHLRTRSGTPNVNSHVAEDYDQFTTNLLPPLFLPSPRD